MDSANAAAVEAEDGAGYTDDRGVSALSVPNVASGPLGANDDDDAGFADNGNEYDYEADFEDNAAQDDVRHSAGNAGVEAAHPDDAELAGELDDVEVLTSPESSFPPPSQLHSQFQAGHGRAAVAVPVLPLAGLQERHE